LLFLHNGHYRSKIRFPFLSTEKEIPIFRKPFLDRRAPFTNNYTLFGPQESVRQGEPEAAALASCASIPGPVPLIHLGINPTKVTIYEIIKAYKIEISLKISN